LPGPYTSFFFDVPLVPTLPVTEEVRIQSFYDDSTTRKFAKRLRI